MPSKGSNPFPSDLRSAERNKAEARPSLFVTDFGYLQQERFVERGAFRPLDDGCPLRLAPKRCSRWRRESERPSHGHDPRHSGRPGRIRRTRFDPGKQSRAFDLQWLSDRRRSMPFHAPRRALSRDHRFENHIRRHGRDSSVCEAHCLSELSAVGAPRELQDANPCRIWRLVDGQPSREPLQ